MLDSNAVDTSEEAEKAHRARYAEKAFGIRNLMVQKKLGANALVYFGIDNLFAKRDDDRAFPGRHYRLGMNLRFDAASGTSSVADEGAETQSAPFAGADWFIRRDTALRRGEFRLSGDYRLRHDSHTGEDRGAVRATETRDVGDAANILADRPAHGYAQRLRIRAAAGLGERTEALVTGSTGSTPDVRETIAENSGLSGGRLERAELRRREGAFDISLGRLEERIGVTGYYFGRDYDGARAVWTGAHTQVRLGGDNFSKSTGIKDTAYTKMIPHRFLRSFTKREFLGLYENIESGDTHVLPNAPKGAGMNYWAQYVEAAKKDAAEQKARKLSVFFPFEP